MRPTLDEYLMRLAEVAASRGTCPRRQVGAVLSDERGHVLAVGYNGSPAGMPHCSDSPCPGAAFETGRLDECEAIHAEQNALIQCSEAFAIRAVHVTLSPCIPCFKLLLGTGVRRVVYRRRHSTVLALEELAGRVNLNRTLRGEPQIELVHFGEED